MKYIHSNIIALIVAVAFSGATGCTGVSPKGSLAKKMPWSKKDKKPEPYPNPTRMAATWTPDTLVQTGRTPTRGFGGRLFFYDDKTKAVPVDGELTVHAFAEDADGSQGEVKRYHFTAEQFTQHFSQTDIGASYSVWIPWDAVGGDQTRISLVPSFRTKTGRLVQGEQALVGLPGKRSQVDNIAARPTAASILEKSRGDGKSGLVTTTIPVRSALLQRDHGNAMPTPGLPIMPTQSIAKQSPTPIKSFDVDPRTLQIASTPTPAAIAPSSSTPIDVPATSRPLRLGQRMTPTRGVIHASANLPVE
jgi:hypothetical protein